MRLHDLRLLGVLCFSSIPFGVANAAPLQITEEVFFDTIPPVVSASRQQLSLTESPSSVTIISRDMIEAMPVFDLADLLRIAPGFQSFKANASIHAVTLHGQANRFPRRLEIRVDGRTAYTPINSAVSWESLGLVPDDIERIEVVRGSNIPAYGGNAAQGAINIITRNPRLDNSTRARLTVGSWNTRNVSFRHSFDNEGGNYSVRGAWKKNDGFKDLDDDAAVGHLAIQGLHAPSFRDELFWETGFSKGRFGFGDGDRPEEFADEHISNGWVAGHWARKLNRQSIRLHGSLSAAEYDRSVYKWLSTYDSHLTPVLMSAYNIKDGPVQTQAGQRRFQQLDVELEHQIALGTNSDFLWGSGIRYLHMRADEELNHPGYYNDAIYHLFANHQWRATRWFGVNLGVMAEHHAQTSWNISPRLSLNFHLNENHHLRLSSSEARRSPTLYELEFLSEIRLSNGELYRLIFITDPDIQSEKFRTHELGYLGSWLNGRLVVDYRLFKEDLQNGIDRERRISGYDERIYKSAYRVAGNVSYWTISGYDMQIRWRPDPDWLISLQHANVRVSGRILGENNECRTCAVSILNRRTPNHTSSLLLQKHFNAAWSGSIAAYHQSTTSWAQGTDVERWTRIDTKLSRGFDLSNGNTLEIALIIQNLFDESYLEYQQGNEFPRLTFVSASWQLP